MTDSYLCKAENIEVFCDSKIIWMGAGTYTNDNIVYIPFATENGQVGYVVHSLGEQGEQEFIYLNASTDTDDGKPNVFIYHGESGNPTNDEPLHHYRVALDWNPRFGDVELDAFKKNLDGEWPKDTNYLYELSDGQLFEDAQGCLFNKVGHGPVQGSVEIVDDDELHAYWDVTTRVRIHGERVNK